MRRLLIIVLLVVGLVSTGQSQDAPSAAPTSSSVPSSSLHSQRQQEFALNNLTFALYHEAGHLLISEFSLPILGKEEDAADNIATMLLLAKQADETNRALMDSSVGWQLSSVRNRSGSNKAQNARLDFAALYDSHSPDYLRAGQIGCLMVGSRREVFAHVAVELGLDDNELDECGRNLGQVVLSWARLKSSFIANGPPTGAISFHYDEVPSFGAERAILMQSGLFEGLASDVLAKYALPRDISLRAGSCGSANAYFDPAAGELLICYELARLFLEMGGQISTGHVH